MRECGCITGVYQRGLDGIQTWRRRQTGQTYGRKLNVLGKHVCRIETMKNKILNVGQRGSEGCIIQRTTPPTNRKKARYGTKE